jgi:hypothetical protein
MLRGFIYRPGGPEPVIEARLPEQSSLPTRVLAEMAGVTTVIGSVFHLMYTQGEQIMAEHTARIDLDGHLHLNPSDEIRKARAKQMEIVFPAK